MEAVKKKIPTGTKEWATSNVNLISGCSHNCRYCYAKKMAIRFGRKREQTWKTMELNENKLNQNYRKRRGRVMFPSSHDIVPEFKDKCFDVLSKLLYVGNQVLITSKPHFDVIRDLCQNFLHFKNQIQFRFTITSINNKILGFWEENAPKFEERLNSLEYAFLMKYRTSVSIEPFLDKDPIPLIKKIYPYVSETIWIGKMNYIRKNNLTHKEEKHYLKIRQNYKLENIQSIINRLAFYEKIRYKNSIREMNLIIPSFQVPKVKC